MNNRTRGLLTGALLGDGYLVEHNRQSMLAWQHAKRQEEYALHKAEVFSASSGLPYKAYYVKPTTYPVIRVVFSLPEGEFRYYHRLFYPNGNKTIGRHELNWLDAEALSWWYQDDGSLSVYTNPTSGKTQRHVKWCSHSFTYDENVILRNYLAAVHNVEARVKQEKGKYWFLWLGAQAARTLFDVIGEYVHPSMMYKTDLKY